jgi:hypothetical protein
MADMSDIMQRCAVHRCVRCKGTLCSICNLQVAAASQSSHPEFVAPASGGRDRETSEVFRLSSSPWAPRLMRCGMDSACKRSRHAHWAEFASSYLPPTPCASAPSAGHRLRVSSEEATRRSAHGLHIARVTRLLPRAVTSSGVTDFSGIALWGVLDAAELAAWELRKPSRAEAAPEAAEEALAVRSFHLGDWCGRAENIQACNGARVCCHFAAGLRTRWACAERAKHGGARGQGGTRSIYLLNYDGVWPRHWRCRFVRSARGAAAHLPLVGRKMLTVEAY